MTETATPAAADIVTLNDVHLRIENVGTGDYAIDVVTPEGARFALDCAELTLITPSPSLGQPATWACWTVTAPAARKGPSELDVALAVCQLPASMGADLTTATVQATHADRVANAYRDMRHERDALQAKLDTILRVLDQDAASARDFYNQAYDDNADPVELARANGARREAGAAARTARRIAESRAR